MNNNTLKSVVNKARQRRYIKRGLALLCVFVLLFTMNTLKRNANTLERVPMCGYAEEHVHMPECYDGDALVCGRAEHIHTDACYQEVPGDGDEMNVQLADTPVEDLDSENLDGLLSLSEDDFALVTDDVAPAQPVSNATEAQPKAFILGEGTMVSRIIDAVGLDVSLAAIINVAVVDDATMQADAVGIEKDGDDYRIFATRDFDRAQLALVVEGDILLVDLLDGVAVRETSDAPAEIAEETAPAAPVAEEIMPVIEDSPVEDSPAGEAIEERIDLPEPAQEAQEATPAAEADETGDITLTEDAQLVEGEIIETGEQPAEDEATETEEEPAEDEAVETGEQSADEEAAETEGEPAEDEAAETEEEPAEDEASENEEQLVEDEVTETGEQSAEDEASENEEQLVEDEVTETGEQPAEDEASETEEQPVEGEVSETEEQTAEEDTPETEEQPIEEEATETGEQPVEDEASETEEQSDEAKASTEEVADEGQAIYTATVDLAEVTDYPLSLNALLAGFAPENEAQAEETPEPAGEDGTEAKPNEAPAGASALSIEYDHDLLDIEAAGDDYLITPVASFASTAIVVDNGSRCELTLVNCTLPEAEDAVEAESEARVGYPAQNFEGHTRYVKVVVAAPEGAFPEGTTMAVADVEDEKTLTDIEDTVSEEFVEVKRVHAVDITFRDAEGNEIEPLMPISVVMTVDEIGQRQEAVVVHVDDAGAAEVVDSQSEAPAGETEVKVEMPATEAPEAAQPEDSEAASVGFDADSFSVYAVVITETIDTKYIDAEGATWNISVGYGPEAGIPAGATLAVQEVEGDYLEQTTELLRGKETITLARFFDITILDAEGNAVQPAQPVEVKAILAEQSEDAVKAVHFAEDGPEIIEASQEEDAVSFDAASFSVYGIVYTVDFHYTANGRIFGYGIPGGDCASLRALLPALNVASDDPETEADELEAFMAGIADVKFTDSELVRVCPVTAETTVGALRAELGLESQYSAALTEADRAEIDARVLTAPDWALFSLLPFTSDEALTVTMENGDSFIIVVTDAQIATRVLASDGNTYKITLTFGPEAEIPLDAELKAVEIEQGTTEWFDYLTRVNNVVDDLVMSDIANHFFDIEILSNGEKIEPKAAVSVNIALEDALEDEIELKVVHFVEDGPVVMEAQVSAESDEAINIQFETDAFSVYGVITADGTPSGTSDLDGKAFTIQKGDNYLSSGIFKDATHKFKKISSATDATIWVFEATGQENVYNIFTMVHGEKKYMGLTQTNDGSNAAHATLSNTAQGFRVDKVSDGYRLSAESNGTRYFINEFSGSGGNGFAGWSTENDVNNTLALNFVTPQGATGGRDQKYVLIAKYEGEYYVILNDGTLAKTADPVGTVMKIDDPMVWMYTGDNLYHKAKETGFDGNQLASDYYYRYLDPTVADALTEEDIETTVGHPGAYATEYFIDSRQYMYDIQVVYENHTIRSKSDGSSYIGVAPTQDGGLKIVGQQGVENAGEIYLVKMINESDMSYSLTDGELHHAVNHIDISVVGRAAFSIPLAYGTYYYKDQNGTVQKIVVTRQNPVSVDIEQEVGIDREDVKRANITAYKLDETGNPVPLDDVFHVFGYSGNAETDASTNQTRIEGIFKVADLPAMDPNHDNHEQWGFEYDVWNEQGWHKECDYNRPSNKVLEERLKNIIYYTVTTTKTVDFDLAYNNFKLYDSYENAQNGGTEGIAKGSATVKFSNTFDYYDPRNECPPILYWGKRDYWKKGGIIYAEDEKSGSGMDFALGTIEKDQLGLLAIEITKYVIDEAGNPITPLQNVDNLFHVYRSATANPADVTNLNVDSYKGTDYDVNGNYRPVHDKTVTVGDGGVGTVYDYDVDAGMIYIEEDRSEKNLPRTLVDVDGKEWKYKETHLETEYVWRDNGIEYRRHFSKTYSDGVNEAYNSIPEVLGDYKDVNGIDRHNGFLEFFVYNVYKIEPVDIPVKKEWKHQNGSDAVAPDDASITVTLGRYKMVDDPENHVSGRLEINHSVNGRESDGSYYAGYTIKQGNRVIRSGSYDPSNSVLTMDDVPAGDYTLVLSESMKGYSASTTMDGEARTSMPISIVANQTTHVPINTTLTHVEPQSMVTLTVTNREEYNEELNHNKTYTFPAGKTVVITISRPSRVYNGSGFWAKYSVNNGNEQDFPWPTEGDDHSYTYVDQHWEYTLPTTANPNTTIAFRHNWNQRDFFIKAVTLKGESGDAGSGTNAGQNAVSNSGNRAMMSSPRHASANSLQSVASMGNAPSSNVPGMKYVDDETFLTPDDEPYRVTLSNGVWEDVFTGLPGADEHGYKYLYYIKAVDEKNVPEGTQVVIATVDGKTQTSNGETTLKVTNTIPNEKPKVTLRKVDENGQPLQGAKFQWSLNSGTPTSVTIDSPDATYLLDGPDGKGLEDGTYTISEIKAPDGYQTISGNFAFEVRDKAIMVTGNLPQEVTFDGETYTFNIKNKPVENGKLTIVKRWQDFYGNNMDYTGDPIKLKLVQLARTPKPQHIIRVRFYYKGDGKGGNNKPSDYENKWTEVATKAGRGWGSASLTWKWAGTTQCGLGSITYSGMEGIRVECISESDKQYRLNIPNTADDVTITIKVDNGNWNPFDNQPQIDEYIQFSNSYDMDEGYSPTGGTKEITLGENGVWTMELAFDDEGKFLTDDRTTLSKSIDSRPCVYAIVEEELPAGFTVSYSDSNEPGMGAGDNGVLTAYNRKRTADVKLIKVDKTNREIKLKDAEFTLYPLDASQPGAVRANETGIVQTTDSEGVANFNNLTVGYYEIRETEVPIGYTVKEENAAFYIKVTTEGVFTVQKDDQKYPTSWKIRPNDSMVTTNEAGVIIVGNEPKTYPVYIKKVDSTNPSRTLAGAEFDLYGPYNSQRNLDNDDRSNGRKQKKVNEASIVVGDNGIGALGELVSDYYYLYETKAPDGFNTLVEPVLITVNASHETAQGGAVTYNQSGNTSSSSGTGVAYDAENKTYTLTITNNPGVSLPNTGGSGTTPYYVFGSLLALVAVAMLVARRRGRA